MRISFDGAFLKKMPKLRSCAVGAVALMAIAASAPAWSQISDDVVKIGVLADMSGIYSDMGGAGIVEAVKMAIADQGGTINGKKVEIVTADHTAKPDIAATKAREWFDTQGVDMIVSGPSSGTSLAIAKIAAEKKKIVMVTGGVAAQLTNEECSPYTVHYLYDTVALARGTGTAMTQQGGKTWYFLTVDYAFGHSLEKETTQVVIANGGKVLGSVKHPVCPGFFIIPVAGSGVESASSRSGKRRRRHHQFDQGCQRVWFDKVNENRRPHAFHH